jgi:hypothetical protein
MIETLTIEEIKARFDNEWILIDEPITDEALEVHGGKVLLHSKDRDEFDRRALEFKLKRFAVVFTGRPPANMEFVL